MNKRKSMSIITMFFIISTMFLLTSCKNKSTVDKTYKKEVKTEEKVNVKKENTIRKFTKEPLIYNNESIPVLMYHSIDYEKGNELRVPKEVFREQMKYLKDNNYTTLTLDELYEFLQNNKPIPKKSIVITLDDGYVDNYNNALPILKEFDLKGTVFVVTNNVDKEKAILTSNQLKQMDKDGTIEICSHTSNHDHLAQLSYEKQVDTMKKSKEFLEKLLGHEVKYIAYPYGQWNEDTVKAAKDVKYKMAFTTDGFWSGKEDGIYTLDRVYISSLRNMEDFKNRISNPNYKKS